MSSEWLESVADRRTVTDDQRDDIRRRLAVLRFEYRLVLLLRGPLGVSCETTALVLGRSVHGAHCVQCRARKALMSSDRRARRNAALLARRS